MLYARLTHWISYGPATRSPSRSLIVLTSSFCRNGWVTSKSVRATAGALGSSTTRNRSTVPAGPVLGVTTMTSAPRGAYRLRRSEEHTSELQSHSDLVCRLLLEKK